MQTTKLTSYEDVENYKASYPESNFEKFAGTCKSLPQDFITNNAIMQLIDEENFTIRHLS